MTRMGKKEKLSVLALLVIALLFRLPLLTGSFWLDEAAQALEIVRPPSEQFRLVEDFQPPLLHIVLHMAQYFSHTEWFLRLIGAVIPGLISILITYQIGKKLVNQRTGMLASLLLATSSFHIFYSQELRPYALPTMIAGLSWLYIVNWFQTKKAGTFDWKFCVATFFGLFSSYLYPFVLLSQCVYVWLFQPTLRKRLLYTVSIAALGFLPWVPMFSAQLTQGSLVQAQLPGWSQVVSATQFKSLPLVLAKFVFGVVDVELTFVFIAIILAILSATVFLLFRLRSRVKSDIESRALMLVWLLLPIFAAWLVSFYIPILQPKRVLFCLPSLYLLIATITTQSSTSKIPIIRMVSGALIALFFILNVSGTWQYFTNRNLQREGWRQLHQQIISEYPKENSVALFSFNEPFAPWRWYDDGTYPTISTGQLLIKDKSKLSQRISPLLEGQYSYVLLFDYLRDLTDPNNELPELLGSLGFKERSVLSYPNIGFVRVYTRNEAATAYEYRY